MLDAEGTTLMQQHRYAEACPKLAESQRLQPGKGVLLRLGLCDEQLGKTATAWLAFREAATRAQQSGDEALRQLATKRADAIAPRVPRVILVLPADTARAPLAVSLDGVALDRAALGVELPMDPGTHTVEASLSGRATFHKIFTLAERDGLVSIPIDLPAGPERRRPTPTPASVPSEDGTVGTERTMALVLGSVGLAGIVVGSAFGVAAMSRWNRARSECTGGTTGCSPDALSLQSSVNTDALWSTVGFVGGGVGLAGAVVLWWLASSGPTAAAPRRGAFVVTPVLGGNRMALELMGRF